MYDQICDVIDCCLKLRYSQNRCIW